MVSAPHHDPIVIGRSRTGDHCQITLERWLPISGEPGIGDAVNTIHAILAASARSDPARIIGTTAEPQAVRRCMSLSCFVAAKVTCSHGTARPFPFLMLRRVTTLFRSWVTG